MSGSSVTPSQAGVMDVPSSLLFTIGRSDTSRRPPRASTNTPGTSTGKRQALALPAESVDDTDGTRGS